MNALEKMHESSETPESKGTGKNEFLQAVLEKYDALMGDDKLEHETQDIPPLTDEESIKKYNQLFESDASKPAETEQEETECRVQPADGAEAENSGEQTDDNTEIVNNGEQKEDAAEDDNPNEKTNDAADDADASEKKDLTYNEINDLQRQAIRDAFARILR